MLEKETEEHAKKILEGLHVMNGREWAIHDVTFKDGVEFGYNKANEWHYMKDVKYNEDLPQNKDVYYAYVVNVGDYDKPTIERKLSCFEDFKYDVMAYHVIAWKEIVPPKVK